MGSDSSMAGWATMPGSPRHALSSRAWAWRSVWDYNIMGGQHSASTQEGKLKLKA